MQRLCDLRAGKFVPPHPEKTPFKLRVLRLECSSTEIIEMVATQGNLEELYLGSMAVGIAMPSLGMFEVLHTLSAPMDLLLALVPRCPRLKHVRMASSSSSRNVVQTLLPVLSLHAVEVVELGVYLSVFGLDCDNLLLEINNAMPSLGHLAVFIEKAYYVRFPPENNCSSH